MKRLIMATMVTAVLASSTVWAADNAPVAAQQQTQQVKQTQKTTAAERISEQGLYAMRDVQVAPGSVSWRSGKGKRTDQ